MVEQIFKIVLNKLVEAHPDKWSEAPKNTKPLEKGVYFVLFRPDKTPKQLTVQHYSTVTQWIQYVKFQDVDIPSELYEHCKDYSFGWITLNKDYKDEEGEIPPGIDYFNKKYCTQLRNDLNEIVESLGLEFQLMIDS